MSLHDEILDIRGDTEENNDKYYLGLSDAKQEAAALAIKYDAEIARLSVALEAAQSALKEAIQDCSEAYDKGRADQAVDDLPGELQIAAMGHDAQRITGENAVLRDLLRDAMDVMWAFGQHGGDWIASKILEERITAALKSSAGVPSDGQIYAAASRRAAPEWHAEVDKLLGINDGKKMTTINVIINGIEYRPVATLPAQSSQMPLCDTLRALRKSAKLTLQGAGDLAGITKSYLWGLEKAAHHPSLAVAKRLADLYGVSLLDLAACQTANPGPKQ
jgi:DNA-binding XRE family transcriptional regulator